MRRTTTTCARAFWICFKNIKAPLSTCVYSELTLCVPSHSIATNVGLDSSVWQRSSDCQLPCSATIQVIETLLILVVPLDGYYG